ncbi:MAG: hypothetical protein AABZ61_09595, partial [Bacteroidota bacterium]
MMRTIIALMRRLLAATLILGCCYIFCSPQLAAFQQIEQKATGELDLRDFNESKSEMRGVIERYLADRGSLSRVYTIETSSARQTQFKQFYTDWLAALEKLDFDAMSQDGRVDYLLFKNLLGHELRQLGIRAKAFAEMAPLIPFAETIIDLEEARRRMESIDSPKTAALLTTMNKQIDSTRKAVGARLKSEGKGSAIKVKKFIANRAAETIKSLRKTLKDWFGFYNGYDPIFTWWV